MSLKKKKPEGCKSIKRHPLTCPTSDLSKWDEERWLMVSSHTPGASQWGRVSLPMQEPREMRVQSLDREDPLE